MKPREDRVAGEFIPAGRLNSLVRRKAQCCKIRSWGEFDRIDSEPSSRQTRTSPSAFGLLNSVVRRNTRSAEYKLGFVLRTQLQQTMETKALLDNSAFAGVMRLYYPEHEMHRRFLKNYPDHLPIDEHSLADFLSCICTYDQLLIESSSGWNESELCGRIPNQ